MIIGCPTEVKNNEYRVGLTPSMALDLITDGHKVLIQKGAGIGSGFSDENYRSNGAIIMEEGTRVIEDSEMIIKVKEPQKEEALLQPQSASSPAQQPPLDELQPDVETRHEGDQPPAPPNQQPSRPQLHAEQGSKVRQHPSHEQQRRRSGAKPAAREA